MASRPANTGSGGAAAPRPPDAAAPRPPDAAAPRPPDASTPRPPDAAAPASHRAARSRPSRGSRDPAASAATAATAAGPLAWLPYLVVLAGVAAGMFIVWQGSKYAGRGSALVGASLLAGALARLILPARWAGLLSSRRKASDVLAFAAFGAAVLAVAIALP